MKAAMECDSAKEVFDQYLPEYREPLLQLRTWILQTAQSTTGVGEIEETLKWGQPSYLTTQSKSGSTIRIDWFDDNKVALFFNCQTTLVESFKSQYGDVLAFSKNRAVVLDIKKPLPENAIRSCIRQALTYHSSKKANTKAPARRS